MPFFSLPFFYFLIVIKFKTILPEYQVKNHDLIILDLLLLTSQKKFMSKRNSRNKRSGISREAITEQVKTILSGNPQQTFNYKQISKRLNINDPSEKQMVSEILRELVAKEAILEVYQGKFKLKAEVRG